MPTFGSLFAGIGGLDLGLERAGWACRWQVELDPFCQRVLAKHWPIVTRYGDIRTLDLERIERVDLICGGFPCQDLSVAGKRAGLSGERSGLFYEIVRIAQELQPAWGLFENVPGLLSSHRGRDFWLVLRGLRECWPAVGWRVLDSRHFGVAQRRRRVFLVCGPTEAGVAEVLALAAGGAGDSEAGGEAGARAAAGAVFGTLNSGGNAGGFRTEPGEHLVSNALQERGARGVDSDCTQSLIVNQAISAKWAKGTSGPAGDEHHNLVTHPRVTHALSAEGHDASEDGTGRGTPLVAIPISADALRGEGSAKTPSADAEGRVRLRDPGLGIGQPGDPADTLAAAGPGAVAYRKAQKAHDPDDCERWEQDELTDTLAGHGTTSAEMIQAPNSVRRLTPVECERLQGFPDGWTCLCQPLEAYAEDADSAALRCTCPDSPRYRALGNAVTVNVIEALGARLLTVLTRAGQA
jgi:DNA (cytosine-5)-methyltransferase 1